MSIKGEVWGDEFWEEAVKSQEMFEKFAKIGSHEDHLRQTGRTSRMLDYALREAYSGRYVIIYFDDSKLADYMIKLFHDITLDLQVEYKITGSISRGVKISVGNGEITFDPINEDFDWRQLRKRDVHPDCICLVDHHVIEKRYPVLTNMLYRFIK